MSNCSQNDAHNSVVDSWEEAGDEVSVQLEQRQRQILKKKQKEEELARARETAMEHMQQCSSQFEEKPSGIKILRRPQSCGTLPSSSKSTAPKTTEQQAKMKSLQEREAAYFQARERIFGGNYNPDEETDPSELGPTIVPLPAAVDDSPSSGALSQQPRLQYPTPVPRPRACAPLRAIRTPHFQPVPASHGLSFVLPPPMSVFSTGFQPGLSGPTAPMAYYDSRIRPPGGPVFPLPKSSANDINDLDSNPVPYGRPPAQLLSQTQFSAAFNAAASQQNL